MDTPALAELAATGKHAMRKHVEPQDAPPEPPTAAELYLRAQNTSHLELRDRRCDVDRIIAAGLCGDGLGILLYRLQCEFDAVRAEHEQAENHLAAGILVAEIEASSVKVGPTREAQIREDVRTDALTARVLILSKLRTLFAAKQRLGDYAIELAWPRWKTIQQYDLRILAGRCLEVFLDPGCNHCHGLGYTGGHLSPRKPCRPCGESGKRDRDIGRDQAEISFVAALLAEMDDQTHQAAGHMRRNLKAVDKAKLRINEELRK